LALSFIISPPNTGVLAARLLSLVTWVLYPQYRMFSFQDAQEGNREMRPSLTGPKWGLAGTSISTFQKFLQFLLRRSQTRNNALVA